MALVEAAATLVVISGLLGGLVITSNSLRTGGAELETRTTLQQLRAALVHYQTHHDAPPPGPTPNALAALLEDTHTRGMLRNLKLATDDRGRLTLNDGFGNPIQYFDPDSTTHPGPDFVSPGPDGRLGDFASESPADQHAALDDIAASDLEVTTP